jgi:cystathionine beta-lyase
MAIDNPTPFDTVIDRKTHDSLKWAKYRDLDIIPMWVADMDFHSPRPVIEALQQLTRRGVFGYPVKPDGLNTIVAEWVLRQHRWTILEDWIVWLPSLVCGLNVACRGLCGPQQQVATFTPIYPPFLSSPHYSERNIIRSPLQRENNRWTFDLEQFENAVTDKTALLLLCSPHNPVGRVWTRQELTALTDICLRKNILICSDEIHCDLVLEPSCRHIPTAALGHEIADRTITLMAASKTFNIPGLNCAFAIIPNAQLRRQFRQATFGIIPHVNAFGFAGTQAAFTRCDDWHRQLIEYLRQNRNLLAKAVSDMPGLKMDTPEATYLGWLDCRELGENNLSDFFESAGVGLSDGGEFEGKGFMRLNFGCPQSTLYQAIERIQKALNELNS